MPISKIMRRLSYPYVEGLFRQMEQAEASRGRVLESIPAYRDRMGGLGTTTFGEWCYTIGIFHGVIHRALPEKRPFRMLDVGCGTGRLFLATQPHMGPDDRYKGLDIDPNFIRICQRQYDDPRASFVHFDAQNAYYADAASADRGPWPFEDASFDLVTALSVWTHLREEDWCHYLQEVGRVLAPGGRAVISFFVLDEHYNAAAPRKSGRDSAYYPQPENKWIFDKPAYDSAEWRSPAWVTVPEVAIGVKKGAFDREVAKAGLTTERFHPGSWKDRPALFFQDIAEFRRGA